MRSRFTVTIVAVLLLLILNTIPVLASQDTLSSDETEEIVQIALPDENGNVIFYTGDEAKIIYEKLQEQTLEEIPDMKINSNNEISELLLDDNMIQPLGMFTYKYRFIKSSSGTKYGKTRRITEYLKNQTSTLQSKSVTGSTSVAWTIDTNLTGKYKDAFEGSVGIGWQKSSSFSQTLIVNVPAKKRVWLEFQPAIRYVKGEVQKYYVTRGPRKTTVIESRKAVYSTSPKTITMTLGGKTFKAPDGAYIWKEDKNIK